MRRLFSRAASPVASEPGPALPDISLNCAHGCLACPHPATWSGFDDDSASNLLPASGTSVDGQSLHFEAIGHADAFHEAGDFDADGPDANFEAPD